MLTKGGNPNFQAAAIKEWFILVGKSQEKLSSRMINYMDEMHLLSKDQLNGLKLFLANKESPLFLKSKTFREFELMVGRDNAIRRRFQTVNIPEISVVDTLRLMKVVTK